jgi:hypothetical protein
VNASTETNPNTSPVWLLAYPLVVPLLMLRAWVLVKLWGWYITPAFDIQPMRVVLVFGILLIAAELLPHRRRADFNKFLDVVMSAAVSPMLTLGIGWLGTFFI